jgi:hypothetical protein
MRLNYAPVSRFSLKWITMTRSGISTPKKVAHPLTVRIARHWTPRGTPRRGFLAFLARPYRSRTAHRPGNTSRCRSGRHPRRR